jgi:hypothetical protein
MSASNNIVRVTRKNQLIRLLLRHRTRDVDLALEIWQYCDGVLDRITRLYPLLVGVTSAASCLLKFCHG